MEKLKEKFSKEICFMFFKNFPLIFAFIDLIEINRFLTEPQKWKPVFFKLVCEIKKPVWIFNSVWLFNWFFLSVTVYGVHLHQF